MEKDKKLAFLARIFSLILSLRIKYSVMMATVAIGLLCLSISTARADNRNRLQLNHPSDEAVNKSGFANITGGSVLIAPNWGVEPAYSGADLLVNAPAVNLDRYLLQQRSTMLAFCHRHRGLCPDGPIVWPSGAWQVQASHADHNATYQRGSVDNLDLSQAELDVAVLVNPWITGYMALSYDNAPASSGRRLDNARLFLNQGFINIGHLSQWPLYLTVGQFYVPFGQYSSAMISDPITAFLGKTKARALTLGFSKSLNLEHTVKWAAFAFKEDRRVSPSYTNHYNYGADLQYGLNKPSWQLDVGAGYISNLADAMGFTDSKETTVAVPGLDVRATVALDPLRFTTEYVMATRAFSNPLNFQGHGAKPAAWHVEAVYQFKLWGKPSSVALGYDQTKEALALSLPKSRYIATVSTSIWRHTLTSLEFYHGQDYQPVNRATGQHPSGPSLGTGQCVNALTLRLGVYF